MTICFVFLCQAGLGRRSSGLERSGRRRKKGFGWRCGSHQLQLSLLFRWRRSPVILQPPHGPAELQVSLFHLISTLTFLVGAFLGKSARLLQWLVFLVGAFSFKEKSPTITVASFFESRKKFSTTYAIVLFFFLPTFSWKFQISQKLSIRFSRNFAQSFYTQRGSCVCKGIKIVWLGCEKHSQN